MYAGRIVEQGTLDEIFYDPQHPYTWGLLGSITRVDRPRPERLPAIAGLPPSLADRPEGCHFRPRCPHEFGKCREGRRSRPASADAPAHLRPLLARRSSRSASCARCAGRDRPARQGGRGGMSDAAASTDGALLEVEHLKLHFPIRDGILIDREVAQRPRRGRRDLRPRRGRDARAGGGVRLRQDHAVARAHAPARAHRRAASASAART